jgi:hypothetical protein
MKQRGRQPSSLALVSRPLDIAERPQPPHQLNEEEVEVWVSIVNQETSDWFTAATVPLLAQYCRHVVHSNRIAELIEHTIHSADTMPWIEEYNQLLKLQERESKAMMLLARSMRLTQQTSRHDKSRKTVTLRSPHARIAV